MRTRTAKSAGKSAAPADGELTEALTFLQVLWEVDHALSRRSKWMARQLGVTGPQRLAVRLIGRFPKVSAGDISTLLRVDPSTLTGILDRLVRAGVVRRIHDQKDRRRAQFLLTAEGRKLDRRRTGTIEDAVLRVMTSQPKTRVKAAKALLLALATELSKIPEEAGS